MKTKTLSVTIALAILFFLVSKTLSQNSLHCLEFRDDRTAITVGDNGSMFRTPDKGEQWTPLAPMTIFNLNKISVAGSMNIFAVGNKEVVLRSKDGGETWNSLALNLRTICGVIVDLNGVAVNSTGFGYIVGSNGAIIRTSDNGDSWQVLSFNRGLAYNSVAMFGNNKAIVTGENSSILITNDGGETWGEPTNTPNLDLNIHFVRMLDENLAYAAASEGQILKTTNGGANWTVSYSDPDRVSYYRINKISENKLICAGDAGHIIMSLDSGTTWSRVSCSSRLNLYCLNFADENTGFAAGENGVMLKTSDGGYTWNSFDYLKSPGNSKSSKKENLQPKISPNPFNPVTSISYVLDKPSFVTVQIFDITGKCISLITDKYQDSGKQNVTFDGSGYSSGIYFVRVISICSGIVTDKTTKMILSK